MAILQGLHGWSTMAASSARLGRIWQSLCLAGPPMVMLFFYLVARFVAARIKRAWQDQPPSVRQQERIERYCTPLFRQRLHRKMQRTLDWNPIAWLQQYSWKARLGKWGLCLFFILFPWAVSLLGQHREESIPALLLSLAAVYTFAGVSGFLEEKRSGALELLLVTPIPVNKLIFGRVWGLWKQFLPAALVVLGLYYCESLAYYIQSAMGDYFSFAGFHRGYYRFETTDAPPIQLLCIYLTLPVFATYFALRVKNLIVATVLTWAALGLPLGLVSEAQAWVGFSDAYTYKSPGWAGAYLLSYGAFALLACFLLRHSLSRRIYSF